MNARVGTIWTSLFVLAGTALPAHAGQRAFVASYGSDANTTASCFLATPCRSFAAAMTVVDSGGEVVALDAAGYAPLTITKSVTITANPGFYAGISVASGTGVTVDGSTVLPHGIDVTLRGLQINGVGGATGIAMTSWGRLTIENCVITNFSGHGIRVVGFDGKSVRVLDTRVRDNGLDGFHFDGNGIAEIVRSTFLGNQGAGVSGLTTTSEMEVAINVSDSVLSGNSVGMLLKTNLGGDVRGTLIHSTVASNDTGVSVDLFGGTVLMTVASSAIIRNHTAFLNSNGIIESLGNNTVRQNDTVTNGTLTTVPPI